MNYEAVVCKECKKRFIIIDVDEYILSYCEGCDRLVCIYKYNPAMLAKDKDKPPVFISSGPGGKCRVCGNMITVRNSKDYFSARCVECGFSIVYRMPSHRGVARFISGVDFSKDKYWLSGKRQADRKKKEDELKGKS